MVLGIIFFYFGGVLILTGIDYRIFPIFLGIIITLIWLSMSGKSEIRLYAPV